MNPDTVAQFFQKGFRVTLGAATSLIETLQDPKGQTEKFSEIGTDFGRLTEEFETKGETTEQEARKLVDSMVAQMPNPFGSSSPSSAQATTVNTVATPVVDSGVQTDLQTLTEQLASIRQELEELRNQDSQS